MIRVHRLIARLNVGGPAMHVTHLAGGLDPERFRTTLLAGPVGPDEGDMGYFARERGVSVGTLPDMVRQVSPRRDVATLRALVRTFRRDRPHVVHTHTAKAGALGRLAARMAGVPVVVHTFHGHVLGGAYFAPPVTAFYRALERRLARMTSALVTLTEGLADELAEAYRVAPRDHFRVIPLGLDLGRFASMDRATTRDRKRAEVGVAGDVPVVGIVGRLVPVKNHELLFRAVRALRRTHPGVEVWVVGSGEREEELRRVAADLELTGAIRWFGWQSDLAPFYAGMDVLALTSLDEGTPVAILEALASGTPVAATAVGGVPEVLSAVGTRYELVSSGDSEGLCHALDRLLSERGPRGRDAGARQRVAHRFAVERLCRDMEGLYLELLEGREATPPRGKRRGSVA